MSKTGLTLSIDGAKREGDHFRVDYLPFGVKPLRLIVEGKYKELFIRPHKLSKVEEGEVFGLVDQDDYPDDGELPVLIISWGGGCKDGYHLKYDKEKKGQKAIVHFLAYNRAGTEGKGYPLRIEARKKHDSPRPDAHIDIHLSWPDLGGSPIAANRPVRFKWPDEYSQQTSEIVMQGDLAPDYIARWWPRNQVRYDQNQDPPPQMRLDFTRKTGNTDNGLVVVYADGRDRSIAEISGSIPYPLYDMRQVVPELYRFTLDTWVLRVWFFWLDSMRTRENLGKWWDLTEEETGRIWQEACQVDWGGLHEIPDAERVDIVFTNELEPLYAATDWHWREYWGEIEDGQDRIIAAVANTRIDESSNPKEWLEFLELGKSFGQKITNEVLEQAKDFFGRLPYVHSQGPKQKVYEPHRPHGEVYYELTGEGIPMGLRLGPVEMHTPLVFNVKTIPENFISTDVRNG